MQRREMATAHRQAAKLGSGEPQRELANSLRPAAELVPLEAQPLQRREIATALRHAAELGSGEAQLLQRREMVNFCNAVSWPMLSGKLLYGIVGDTLVGARGGRPPG